MLRALNFKLAGAALLAGCVFISLENAQHSADLAAPAAASCPAAAGAAEDARKAAAEADQAAQDFQTHQDQARALTEEAERIRGEADLYRQRAREAEIRKANLERQKAESSVQAAAIADFCRALANEMREDEDDILPDIWLDDSLGGAVQGVDCACDSVASCEAEAEKYDDEAAFLETTQHSIPEAEADMANNLAAAERAETRARELEEQAAVESEQATNAERAVEDAEGRAAEAAAQAQEIAFEKCGEGSGATFAAPGPDGTYNQDIFGSQGRGVGGGACSPGMQATCAGIQSQCTASCGPGGVGGCSPGAPTPCLACFAAGCI